MDATPGTAPPGRRATLVAASTTLLVAVGSDVAAGGHPLHTATLGAVAAVVAVMRLRLAGHSGMFAAISAALLIQPVLHAATKLVPSGMTTGANGAGHAVAEASVSVLHVLVAALVVAVVVASEQLYLLIAELVPIGHWLRLLLWRVPRPQLLLPSLPPTAAPARRWSFVAHIPRRGPPALIRAAA